jgi:hypothetical protein
MQDVVTKSILEQVLANFQEYPELPWVALGAVVLWRLASAARSRRAARPARVSPEAQAVIDRLEAGIDEADTLNGQDVAVIGDLKVVPSSTWDEYIRRNLPYNHKLGRSFTRADGRAICKAAKKAIAVRKEFDKAQERARVAGDVAPKAAVALAKAAEASSAAYVQEADFEFRERLVRVLRFMGFLSVVRDVYLNNKGELQVVRLDLSLDGKTSFKDSTIPLPQAPAGMPEADYRAAWLKEWSRYIKSGRVVTGLAVEGDKLVAVSQGDGGPSHATLPLPKPTLADWTEAIARARAEEAQHRLMAGAGASYQPFHWPGGTQAEAEAAMSRLSEATIKAATAANKAAKG